MMKWPATDFIINILHTYIYICMDVYELLVDNRDLKGLFKSIYH